MDKTFNIAAVLLEQEINGIPYVLVRWEDTDPSDDTWEPLFNLSYEFVRNYLRNKENPKTSEKKWGSQGSPGPRSQKPASYMPTPELIAMDSQILPAVCVGCLQDFAEQPQLWQHERSCPGMNQLQDMVATVPRSPLPQVSWDLDTYLEDESLPCSSLVNLAMWEPLDHQEPTSPPPREPTPASVTTPTDSERPSTSTSVTTQADSTSQDGEPTLPSTFRPRRLRKSRDFYKE